MLNKYITVIVALIVGVVVFMASVPIFTAIGSDTETTTNEGASNIRYSLEDSHSAYNLGVVYDSGDETIKITNGTNTQLIEEDAYIYADNNFMVIGIDGHILFFGKDIHDTVVMGEAEELPVTIARTSSGVDLTADGMTHNFGAPTYAYVPLSTGKYATFYNDGETEVRTDSTVKDAFFGSYAGVVCYNNINTFNLDLTLVKFINDGLLSGGQWIASTEEDQDLEDFDPSLIDFDPSIVDPLNPSVIDLDPLEPGIIDPGNMIMSVPTPTYIDGNWGYDLKTVDGVQKAVIVSYSGSGGTLDIPATVGGYDVIEIGKGGSGTNTIFDNANIAPNTSITIANGPTKINGNAFNGATNLTGTLTIPASVTSIESNAFNGCTGLTSINLSNVQTIKNSAFSGCTGLTGNLVIPDSVTSLGVAVFKNCSGLNGTLTLGSGITSLSSGNEFNGCNFTGSLIIPSTLKQVGSTTDANNPPFAGCKFTSLIINEGVEIIGQATFANITTITGDLVIPDSVTSLGAIAFRGCTGLTSVKLPSGITEITNNTFYGCTGLTGDLVIPEGVTIIKCTSNGNGPFNGCTGLNGTLVLPSTLETISDYAFRYCEFNNIVCLSDSTFSANSFYQMSTVKNILNLGSSEFTTTSYGLNADIVDDHIEAYAFIANVDYNNVIAKDGAIYDLLNILPLIMSAGIVLFALAVIFMRRI